MQTESATVQPLSHPAHLPTERSILDGIERPAPAATAPALVAPKRRRAPAWLGRGWANPWVRYTALAVLLGGLGTASFFAFWPVQQPDYALDPMDEVLDYTLLTDAFNKLPVDKRLELIGELVQRVKTMSGDDSALMAAFAASINTDALRRQLEENASRLALDVWDKYARDYQQQPGDQREAYLDKTLVDMEKTLETLAGINSDKTDEQRLSEARAQAKRDQKALASGEGPTAGQLARVSDILRNKMGAHSPPQQQQRGMQLMRDMTRHLRGQDPVTGKPAANP